MDATKSVVMGRLVNYRGLTPDSVQFLLTVIVLGMCLLFQWYTTDPRQFSDEAVEWRRVQLWSGGSSE